MRYIDLTLHQRISLKGEFKTDPALEIYGIIMLLWDFVKAVEYFLNDDLSILRPYGHMGDIHFDQGALVGLILMGRGIKEEEDSKFTR